MSRAATLGDGGFGGCSLHHSRRLRASFDTILQLSAEDPFSHCAFGESGYVVVTSDAEARLRWDESDPCIEKKHRPDFEI